MIHRIAVSGPPINLLLTALHALAQSDRLAVEVRLAGAATVAIEGEVLRPAMLPPAARATFAPLIVREWTGYHIVDGSDECVTEPVVLVDPGQCRLELANFSGRLLVVDTPDAGQTKPSPARENETARMLSAAAVERLDRPILFARDDRNAPRFLQCLPCGGDNVIVREREAADGQSPHQAAFAAETALCAALAELARVPDQATRLILAPAP